MKPLTSRTVLYLVVDLALLLVCILHIPLLFNRAKVPFDADMINGHVTVVRLLDRSATGTLALGDRLIRFNDTPLQIDHEIEFLGDLQSVGDMVTLTREDGRTEEVRCIPFYDRQYVLIVLIVGLITWGVGVFVLISRPGELAASALHWSLVCMGGSTIMAWGQTPAGEWLPIISRTIFFVVYMGVASIFLFFTRIFPRPKPGPLWRKGAIIFTPAVVILAILLYTHLRALTQHSLADYRAFRTWYDVFHILLLGYVGIGIVGIIRSYRSAENREERQKLQWVMWGLAFGPTPFLLLITIPELVGPAGLVPEEITLIFFVLIPVSFAIACVKYHLFDIELVIKRTTVYAIVAGGVVLMYAAIVGLVSSIVGAYVPEAGVGAALGIALLFEPVRARVQRGVDRRFFRVRYNFREAGRSILTDIGQTEDERQLDDLIVHWMEKVIPVEGLAILTEEDRKEGYHVLCEHGLERAKQLCSEPWDWKHASKGLPYSVKGALEQGVHFIPLGDIHPAPEGIVALFPIPGGQGKDLLGCIAVGQKRSGVRFTAEDVDLLMEMGVETGSALKRIRLQRRLLLEQATARRLEELNRLKSDFVSYVSHELRTPLTSIKMFAELLRSRMMGLNPKARGYVGIIDGEAERLARMVTTILDSARIEQGGKEYDPVPADLCRIARGALSAMTFQLKQHRFRVKAHIPSRAHHIMADPTAITQAIINLIANSIKYSPEKKEITIVVSRRNHEVICSVTDRGRGIPEDSIQHLFERFFRDPSVKHRVEGVGLGLPLVKHIMTAHNGAVEVSSAVGAGSTFTLVFPPLRPSGTRPAQEEEIA